MGIDFARSLRRFKSRFEALSGVVLIDIGHKSYAAKKNRAFSYTIHAFIFFLSIEIEVEKIENEIAAAAAEEDAIDENLVCPKTLENEERGEGENEQITASLDIPNSCSTASLTLLTAQPLDAPLVLESGKFFLRFIVICS